ncbi:3-dehydrosphinganine reductase [Amycolatopsis xylanica]|uniref:3-dehydrosphinganine reductase n=1 Tax=Amycolatopsis xylanica TaxID=589385 RepID=A0A1H3GI97_9PSEU|nr:3-dehydrosphinganine reductase [Amycolatopsis xylanica]
MITGGSSGIGLATAFMLARRGASVTLIARNSVRLEAAAVSLRASGCVAHTVAVDVSDQRAITSALHSLEPCDVLVTSAGQARPGHFLELEDSVFRQMVEVDYFGTLYPIRAVAPSMVERGRGSIVAISSATALLGIYGYTAYSPAKFAVRGLMECLRGELRPHGVHVGCVYPPDVDTPQLAEENEFKPAETAAISGAVKPMTAQAVAAKIVRAIERERFAVYPDRSMALLAGLGPLAAPFVRWVTDRKVREARKGS